MFWWNIFQLVSEWFYHFKMFSQKPSSNLLDSKTLSNKFYPMMAFPRLLTHFSPVSHFYTPWKSKKTKGFLTFSGV